jgi:transcriptional repressor NrdR
MKCPSCNHLDTQVRDSRATNDGSIVRRRRYCPACKSKFSTTERIYFKELYVIKRSGVRKPFERAKIKDAIETAVRKRNIAISEVERMVDDIVSQIETSTLKELHSNKIGALVLQALLKVDVVAYVRFASVYKQFSSSADFITFIGSIGKS